MCLLIRTSHSLYNIILFINNIMYTYIHIHQHDFIKSLFLIMQILSSKKYNENYK